MRWRNLFRFREYHNFCHQARLEFKIHEASVAAKERQKVFFKNSECKSCEKNQAKLFDL